MTLTHKPYFSLFWRRILLILIVLWGGVCADLHARRSLAVSSQSSESFSSSQSSACSSLLSITDTSTLLTGTVSCHSDSVSTVSDASHSGSASGRSSSGAASVLERGAVTAVQSEASIKELGSAPAAKVPSAEGIPHNRIALKSNAIGWGLLMANAGVEFGLSRHMTLHVPLYYSGVDLFSERVKFRTLAVQPELRWNFSRTDGFFVGAHTMMAYFNLATGGDYRIQDRSGVTPMLGGGVSVGYRLHFKDNPHWGVEFVLGGGAYRLCYDRFVNENNGPYVDTVNRIYVGPDNVAVSIFYEFGLRRSGSR